MPISSGATPTTVALANLPTMEEERPREAAVERRMINAAAAPSDIGELLPAVVVPVSLKTGLSLAMDVVEAL